MVGDDHPKISICIPTYNYANFLAEAIESVLSQTYDNIEIVVIDNCSTDNTKEVVERYATVDSRVSYVRNDSNVGLTGNLNRCLELARYDFVKILCADDLIAPTCLEKSIRLMVSNPEVVVVSTARQTVSVDLNPLEVLSFFLTEQTIPGDTIIRRCLFEGNIVGEPSSVLFRKGKVHRDSPNVISTL